MIPLQEHPIDRRENNTPAATLFCCRCSLHPFERPAWREAMRNAPLCHAAVAAFLREPVPT